MGKGVKVAAWAALFLGCAGIGAYVAAHSNPFPPGVDRPSGSATVSAPPVSPTPPPPDRWVGGFLSSTYHQLYVGGRCSTRWRGNVRYTVSEAGIVDGTGVARLRGSLECDFPIAQVQVQLVHLAITGRVGPSALTLRMIQTSLEPATAQDFGGFVPFLPVRVVFRLRDGEVSGHYVRDKTDDEGRGTYHWSTVFHISRVSAG